MDIKDIFLLFSIGLIAVVLGIIVDLGSVYIKKWYYYMFGSDKLKKIEKIIYKSLFFIFLPIILIFASAVLTNQLNYEEKEKIDKMYNFLIIAKEKKSKSEEKIFKKIENKIPIPQIKDL